MIYLISILQVPQGQVYSEWLPGGAARSHGHACIPLTPRRGNSLPGRQNWKPWTICLPASRTQWEISCSREDESYQLEPVRTTGPREGNRRPYGHSVSRSDHSRCPLGGLNAFQKDILAPQVVPALALVGAADCEGKQGDTCHASGTVTGARTQVLTVRL